VLNTDAEGRLILADALAYSARWKPAYLVDAATLTGACAHTLDYVASGLMTNDPGLGEKLKAAGERAGERLWEFPLWEEYDEFIKGTAADIQNISRKTAGIQTSGMFLKHFADHAKWAHLDIAGTAYTGGARDYYTVGATGVGVRLFLEFLKQHA
jgi:leucyl aminopeptidase